MKKGIKAVLYLPIECGNIIYDYKEMVVDYLNDLPANYDFYEGEYDGEKVYGINIIILANTKVEVENKYKEFKKFIKKIAKKQPTQVFKMNFDRIG